MKMLKVNEPLSSVDGVAIIAGPNHRIFVESDDQLDMLIWDLERLRRRRVTMGNYKPVQIRMEVAND